MRYGDLGGTARSRALDNAREAWRGTADARSSFASWAHDNLSNFLGATGLSSYGDVVRFEVGDLFPGGGNGMTRATG